MSLQALVIRDCKALLDVKYKWIPHRHGPVLNAATTFKMPEDPTEDVAVALQWLERVKKESVRVDWVDDYWAAAMRDDGVKTYMSNKNILTYQVEETPALAETIDVSLALKRWDELIPACHKCRWMIRALHYNRD